MDHVISFYNAKVHIFFILQKYFLKSFICSPDCSQIVFASDSYFFAKDLKLKIANQITCIKYFCSVLLYLVEIKTINNLNREKLTYY